VLGQLFRSKSFQKDDSELVIIVTPYLVRPSSQHLATPTDGPRITEIPAASAGAPAAAAAAAAEPPKTDPKEKG
jgi:pilus assembly protein CpaC